MFSQIIQIKFFKDYPKWKVFCSWRYYAIRKNFIQRSNNIARHAYILQPFLGVALLKIQYLLINLNKIAAFKK